MLRFLIRLLIVLAVLNAAFNSLWAAAAQTPVLPIYEALALATLLLLALQRLERTALAWRTA